MHALHSISALSVRRREGGGRGSQLSRLHSPTDIYQVSPDHRQETKLSSSSASPLSFKIPYFCSL